jgi:hypothetical protein
MADTLVRKETLSEYFRELVETALHHQHLAARDVTAFYLVNLLTGFIHVDRADGDDDEPLGVRFAKALQEAGIRQRNGLRQVGDMSLFISGFFSDSLNRSLVDVDYYIHLGGSAYGSLARHEDGAFGEVFNELSEKFPAFVDVLGEVSEQSAVTSNSDVLRLYEKWMRTRSRRSGDLLVSRGVVPNASAGSGFIQ